MKLFDSLHNCFPNGNRPIEGTEIGGKPVTARQAVKMINTRAQRLEATTTYNGRQGDEAAAQRKERGLQIRGDAKKLVRMEWEQCSVGRLFRRRNNNGRN